MNDISNAKINGWQGRYEELKIEAKILFEKWNLLPKNWKLVSSRGIRRAGCTYPKTKTIKISIELIARDHTLNLSREILKHEIAHALTMEDSIKDKIKYASHGAEWKAWAVKLGIKPNRCHSIKFGKAPYIRKCPTGCYQVECIKRTRKKFICSKCRLPIETFHAVASPTTTSSIPPTTSPPLPPPTATVKVNGKQLKARWMQKCPNGCYAEPRIRRKQGLACVKCKTPIIYEELLPQCN
jgi:predicted SprT family Zn-dependent metalloprotease